MINCLLLPIFKREPTEKLLVDRALRLRSTTQNAMFRNLVNGKKQGVVSFPLATLFYAGYSVNMPAIKTYILNYT